ncbi:MAG: hypothetical protein OZSIB_1501 [Candidatus Ozemobacter sibiricus]|jgi:hypothetical protein|uniref:DUF3857 domain-containing protein n=1 Tax=Candidatus Ozemobacter sibiricus TaxID=2268124 RepID=A0A367ZKV3_9BACT|nr:MAG: hypothetical protein OZSIB_1501 [Candidatus Ozemobacter sibiricus]
MMTAMPSAAISGRAAARLATVFPLLRQGWRWGGRFLLLFCWCLTVGVAGADVLTLNNGDELFGRAVSASPQRVVFEVDGRVRTFTATEVLELEFETLRMPPGEDRVEAIQDPLVRRALANMPTERVYPEATRVDVYDEDRYDLNADGTWTHAVRHLFVVLKEAGREAANTTFTYFPDLETWDLEYGRAITPGKAGFLGLVAGSPGTVRYVGDRTIADETDFPTIPLYQKRHTVKFAIPEVGLGTLVEWKYRVARTRADPWRPFCAEKVLRGFEPRQHSRLVVSVPAGRALAYKVEEHGIPVQVEVTAEGDRQVYAFSARDVPALLAEPQQPGLARLAPRVVCALADDWAALAASYAAALAPLREEAMPLPALQTLVARLTRDRSEALAKAREIYCFLGKEFTVVDVPPQAYSFLPHPPAVILEKKQGNLIDLVFLYHTLLTMAGVDHRLLLARDKEGGALASEVPSLAQGDFLAIELPGATAPFDFALPVGDHVGPDVRLPFLQGATGVTIPDGRLVTIPFCHPEEEALRVEAEAEVTVDGTLKVTARERPRGNVQAERRRMKNRTRDEIRVELETNLHEQFPGARLIDFSFENLEDVHQPLLLTYRFEVPDFALKSGDDLLVIPVPIDRQDYSARMVGAPRRQTELAWSTLGRTEHRLTIKLPPGFTLHALPEGVAAGAPGLLYASSFGFAVDTVTFRDLFRRDRDRLAPADYPLYKKLMEERAETSTQWIVVKKK